jgi:hypothetical protein
MIRALPLIQVLFRLVPRKAVVLLQFADQMLAAAGNLLSVGVGQLGPLLLQFALHLFPLTS